MSSPDYQVFLDRFTMESLWEGDGSEGFPFGEDDDEIARAIDEEIGSGKRRKRKKKPRR